MGYQDDLHREKRELAAMLREDEEMHVRIARKKRRIAALAELCSDSGLADQSQEFELGGISDAVRSVMRSSRKEWLNVGEIKSGLEEFGFPVKDYKSPIATIITVLKRLVEEEEVVVDKRNKDYAEYKWVGPMKQINALLRTANQFGYTIAELDPGAADRALMGEADLTSAEEREIDLYLRNSHSTVPLTIDQLYRTFSMSHKVRSPRKTREFMQSFLTGPASPFREVRIKGKEPAYIQKRGS
jgi:hypothetical protein